MKLRKGDTVIVIAGGNSKRDHDKGKTGEILKVNEKNNTVVVQGINVVVKHVKPTQNKPEGSVETFEAPIDASNVAYYDAKTKKAVKIGYKVVDGKKIRINKKTGAALEKKEAKAVKAAEAPKAEEKAEVAEKKPAAKKTTTAAKKPAAKKEAAPKAEEK